MSDKSMRSSRKELKRICVAGLLMAMNIIMSSSIMSVPVPGGHLYMNDIVICTASILLGPVYAFAVGGIGAFIGDLLFYPTPMFVSLVTHGLQAVVISVFAHYIWQQRKIISSGIGVTIGAIINVVGYSIGRAFIYSTPEYAVAKLPFQFLQAAVGAVMGMIIVYPLGLYKLARKMGID